MKEYKTIKLYKPTEGISHDVNIDELNDLGKLGWHVVSIIEFTAQIILVKSYEDTL